MLTPHESRLLALYVANIAAGLKCTDPEARELIDWFGDRDNHQIALGANSGRWRRRRRRAGLDDEDISPETLRRLEESLREECSNIRAGGDRTSLRLRCLRKSTGLSRTDIDILELMLRYETQSAFQSMIDDIFRSSLLMNKALNADGWAISLILGLTPNAVRSRLQDDAPLVHSGLVSVDDDGDLKIPTRLCRLVTAPGNANADVTSLLLDAAPPTDLEWKDFDHFAAERDHVEMLLAGALGCGKPGVNILLHGPPGTGKTEFCKALAARLDATLYSVGETDRRGDEPSQGERLSELVLAQRLVRSNSHALLLFDELEAGSFDGFGKRGPLRRFRSRATSSKVFMHRVLEKTPAPTLWTMNDAEEVSETILRRMMFALELRPPTAAVRKRVWARQLDLHGIAATPEETAALASEFEAAPGVAAGATAAARLAGGDVAVVRTGVRSLARLLSCDRPPQSAPRGFDLALIRADIDPATLADRLAAGEQRRFSLCLQGPPGTGKSVFVRYLAERLGMEIVQKRASDLMSMWVGQTEKAIARAFAEARDIGAFLALEEAESLLADRRLAQRNWEVSQVNEMLTWMESHPLPFAATTNFAGRLDPATLRRFVFKVTLDYLAPEQVEVAFRSHFDLPPPPSLANLTPGDFAVVRSKAGILGQLQDPEVLADMLQAECTAKPDRPRGAAGFRA